MLLHDIMYVGRQEHYRCCDSVVGVSQKGSQSICLLVHSFPAPVLEVEEPRPLVSLLVASTILTMFVCSSSTYMTSTVKGHSMTHQRASKSVQRRVKGCGGACTDASKGVQRRVEECQKAWRGMQDACVEGHARHTHGGVCNERAEGQGEGHQVTSQDNKRGLS